MKSSKHTGIVHRSGRGVSAPIGQTYTYITTDIYLLYNHRLSMSIQISEQYVFMFMRVCHTIVRCPLICKNYEILRIWICTYVYTKRVVKSRVCVMFIKNTASRISRLQSIHDRDLNSIGKYLSHSSH